MNVAAQEKIFLVNLTLLLALGTAVLIWIGRFTNLLPVIGSLLSLGGFMAWVAFFFGVLKDHRKERLKDMLDKGLCHLSTTLTLVSIALITGIVLSGFGSVTFESREPSATHYLKLDLAKKTTSKDKDEALRLSPGQVVRKAYWLGWQRQRLTIKTLGLPSQVIVLKAATVVRVELPKHLFREVVLLVPEHRLCQDALQRGNLRLEVYRKKAGSSVAKLLGRIDDYQGNSVWLGCEADVGIPRAILQQWQLELAVIPNLTEQERALIRALWSSPVSLKVETPLDGNETLIAKVINKENMRTLNKEIPLVVQSKTPGLAKHDFDDFIQEWHLKRY